MEQSPGCFGRKIERLAEIGNPSLDDWPTLDEGALEGDVRAQYLNRKLAVRLYLGGESDSYIRQMCGIGLKQVYRLITERCVLTHPDGRIYGWRALIPYFRVRPYKRQNKIRVDAFGNGASGAMGCLLDLHPELRKSFDRRILASAPAKKLGPSKRTHQAHWKWFLEELRKLGYEIRGEWPFCTESNGYSTVCRYINEVYRMNPNQAARAIGGPDLERKMRSGDGVDRPVDRIFQRVEMDAHKLDGRFCILIPDFEGGHTPKIIHRIWVIVILEVVSRAVLGYFMSTGREVSKEDVLRAIKAALTRWRPRIIPEKVAKYKDGAGLPSGISDQYLGVCWDETSVDGALAETCKHVQQILKDVVDSSLISPKTDNSFSSRRSMDDRPFIETWFRNIASAGFQRLSNTTGSNPEKRGGRDPGSVALTSEFQLEYAEDLLDVLIADYNATPHTSLGYRSPLEYLNFASARVDQKLRYADASQVQSLLSYGKRCRVLGGVQQGRAPYINFAGAKYTNEVLCQRFDLVGQYIWVVNHIDDDARLAQASTLDGQSLGILRASPPWHKFPHTLRIRRIVGSYLRKKMLYLASSTDAIESFIEFSESQAGKKLPVHPAYLELRRILAAYSDINAGKTDLDEALERANADDQNGRNPNEEMTGPEAARTQHDQLKNLPRRRMASD